MKSPSRPERVRSILYLRHVRSKPCLICGQMAEAHHLTHAQPRAMSLKTGDQFTVPLCSAHHVNLHESPMRESIWWAQHGILPIVWATNEYNKWRAET